MRVAIKKWFQEKMDLGYGKRLSGDFGEVVKETEKAYMLNVEWYSVDGEYDGYQNVWVPKKCTMTEEEFEAEEKAEHERFEAGCSRYEKMIEFAKANGVKGVRVGLRRETIEKKIREAGLVFAM